MRPELEASIARAQDPQLIPGIYNYCHHRCERCQFKKRCLSYREQQFEAVEHGDRSLADHLEANMALSIELIRAWCEREGVDFDALPDDTPLPGAEKDDPLQTATRRYCKDAHDIVAPLARLSPFHTWPQGVGDAIDTIAWFSSMIPAKTSRAIEGYQERGILPDEDPIQNDWNGSAKVARLAIAESRDAWDTLFSAGETPSDGSIRDVARLLEEIDGGLAARFPDAMAFVRPGFDEPEVAAGALTALAPFEPRDRSVRRRLRLWISRILRWRRRW
jgi:hypothetical protein